MEPLTILHANYLDLLFENRNKLYGAYPLRKYYARRLFAAMGTVLGIVLIFACGVIFFRSKEGITGRIFVGPDIYLSAVPVNPPALKDLVAGKPVAVKHVAVALLTNPLIVPNQPIPQPMATVEELKTAAIGVHAEVGPPATGGPDDLPGSPGVAGNKGKDSIEETPEILTHAQIMPEFPGGPEALKRFLLKNLRMPDTGLEPGSQVRVIAKFVVCPDGSVREINVILSGGTAFDNEVQRVISRMPNWKPGVQNREKVSVYFNLPVNFRVPADN